MNDESAELPFALPEPLAAILGLDPAAKTNASTMPFAVRQHRHQPFRARLALKPGPAEIVHEGNQILVLGHHYAAIIQPATGSLDIYSEEAIGRQSFRTVLRVAVSCHLPFLGGIPLHAAGVAVRPDLGVAFFGVSGAGKSTLAGLCPLPILSDELVLIHSGRIFASGFWGTAAGVAPAESFPVAAFVEIRKGSTFSMTPMSRDQAFRRMISVVQVPAHGPTWRRALASLATLTRETPAYSMTFSNVSNPWPQIEDIFAKVALRPTARGGQT